jgi:hypothetical protein
MNESPELIFSLFLTLSVNWLMISSEKATRLAKYERS